MAGRRSLTPLRTRAWLGAIGMLLLAAGAEPARADGVRQWSVCGGSVSLATCASVHVRVEGTRVDMTVRNLSGLHSSAGGSNWVFTNIGLDQVAASVSALPGTVAMSGPSIASNKPVTPKVWNTYNDKSKGGGIVVDIGASTDGDVDGGIASSCAAENTLPGGKNHIWATVNDACEGGYEIIDPTVNNGAVLISFHVSGTFDPNAEGTFLFVKAQNGGPDGSWSTQCMTGGANANCFAIAGSGTTPDPSVVPEPVTTLLFGTGLLGIAAARRRRRRDDDVEAVDAA